LRVVLTPLGDQRTEETISTATNAHPAQWTCARCEMASTWTNGLDEGTTPPNWAREGGLHYCLVCRRERAIETALEDAGELAIEDRAKLRRSAMVEFEVRRDPERTEGEIAKAARTSIAAVRKARQRLGLRPVTG
jgi:hypothetical protein